MRQTKTLKYEVLQGQDAEAARLAGKKLEWFDGVKGAWMPRHNQQAATTPNDLYRLAPEPVPPKLVPLGPEDVPLGSWFQQEPMEQTIPQAMLCMERGTIYLACRKEVMERTFEQLMEMEWNIFRPGGLAWEPCSKEAK